MYDPLNGRIDLMLKLKQSQNPVKLGKRWNRFLRMLLLFLGLPQNKVKVWNQWTSRLVITILSERKTSQKKKKKKEERGGRGARAVLPFSSDVVVSCL